MSYLRQWEEGLSFSLRQHTFLTVPVGIKETKSCLPSLKNLYDYMVTTWKWNSYFRWHLTLFQPIRYWSFNIVFQTYNIFWSDYEYISVGLIELLWNVSKCWLRIQRNGNLFCHVSPRNQRHQKKGFYFYISEAKQDLH